METSSLTLYELSKGSNEFGDFVKLIANLMSMEYTLVKVDAEKEDKNLKKSFNGKFPVLEL